MSNENKKKTIIIVDDVMFQLVSIKERLKDKYVVYTANSYDVLITHLERIEPVPDLIIMDINMPGKDGFEIAESLKKLPDYSEIPVIFLSSKREPETLMRAMRLGAVDYLVKPVSGADLIEAIDLQLNPGANESTKQVILAVDDSHTILKAVCNILQGKYNVYSLSEPEMLNDLLSNITPDLFILDCNMPKLSGFDLVPIIRSHSKYMKTPIIFLSGEGSKDNLFTAIQLGANDFLAKPIDEKMLREKVAINLRDSIFRRRLNQIASEI